MASRLFLFAVGMSKDGFDAIVASNERKQLDLSFHFAVDCPEMLDQKAPGVPLRGHEREIVFACNVIEAGMAKDDLSGAQRSAVSPQTSIEKGFRAAHPIHEFEGSAPDHEGPRGFGGMRISIDNSNADPKSRHFRGHCQTHRACADD
jgi:hypothetical protein